MAIVRSRPSERIINGNVIKSSESAIVSDASFRTRGEFLIVIKQTPSCTVTLDHSTTDHVIIKALTKVLIIPSIGKIDEEFDEVNIDKGTCVEFMYASGNWYIISSDGLKIDQ